MQANAQKIAEFLANHPRITRVNYAGLEGHPGRDLHFSQVLILDDKYVSDAMKGDPPHTTNYDRKLPMLVLEMTFGLLFTHVCQF